MWDAVTLEALGGPDELSISNLDSRNTSIENQSAKLPPPTRPLPPVASKSYSVASVWEVKAPLSEIQQRAIEVVSASVSTPPLPPHLASLQPVQDQGSSEVEQTAGNGFTELSNGLQEGSFDESVALQNSSEFFKWLSDLEGIRAREAEERFTGHASALQRWIQECDQLLATVDGLTATFEELKDGQRRVNERTAALHETCERLVADRQRLLSTADGLSAKLTYFDELEKISAQFHATALNDKEEDILQSLVRLDECLKFVKAHPHFADAPAYLAKYTQLQIKAHATVRTKIRQGLLNAAQACAPTLQVKGQPEKNDQEDPLAELTLLNVRFRAAAQPSIGVLIKGIEETSVGSSEYEQLMQACINSYSEARLVVLKPLVTKHIKQIETKVPLGMLLRDGWTFLLQVAQLELQLFSQFFPHQILLNSRKDKQSLSPPPASQILEPLGAILSSTLRQLLAPIKDVDQLSEVALVLRSEVLRTQSSSHKQSESSMDEVDGPAVVLMQGAFRQLLSELQQKMVQRAHSMVRDSIIRFKATPHDFNYPGVLVEEDDDKGHEGETDAGETNALVCRQKRGWYPPVSLTVRLLTGLHPVLDTPSFNDIAHESLIGAIAAVQEASRSVTASAGQLHGLLFVVRQLLLLRLHTPNQDCGVPMDYVGSGNLVGQETKGGLDFNHVQDYLKRAISGRLFSSAIKGSSLETNSGQRQSNPRLELDRAVKGACENLIISMTKLSVEPALNFLTKVTAVYGKERPSPDRLGGQGGSESGDNLSQQRRPLREHAFATPERMSEIVKSVNTLIKNELPTMLQLLKAYVPAEEREHTLCVPLKSNINNALTQMATLVEAEYTFSEVESMGLMSTEEVDKLFISM